MRLAPWKHKIYGVATIQDQIADGDISFEDGRDQIVKILRKQPFYSEAEGQDDTWSYSGIVDEDIAQAANVDEYDEAKAMLYDVLDAERVWLDPIR